MHFLLYRYHCKGRYSVNFDLKCLEKSGNLIMTGHHPASKRWHLSCDVCLEEDYHSELLCAAVLCVSLVSDFVFLFLFSTGLVNCPIAIA